MACHAIRLLTETDCGVCGQTVPEGYAVVTDEPEHPVWLVVCPGCTSGLSGLRVAKLAFQHVRVEWPAKGVKDEPAE